MGVVGDRSMTDCRLISVFSLQTGRELGREMGIDLDNAGALVGSTAHPGDPVGRHFS
jgi:hypothetical protein